MILKVQNMQSGEIENVSVMGESDITPDNSRLVGVDMSDEKCLFGNYLDAGYWNELFENEGLDGVQKQLRTLQELPNKIEGLCDPIEDVFNESFLTESEFIDAVQDGAIKHCDSVSNLESDIKSEIDQGNMFEVNGNYYSLE